MNCSKCGKFEAYIVESRLRMDGRRYRRYGCEACGNRWTTHQSVEPEAKPVAPRKLEYRARRMGRHLTNWEAAEILMTTGMSVRQLAAKYNVSHQCVQKILAGQTYCEVYQVLFPY